MTEGPPYPGTMIVGCVHAAMMQPCTCDSDETIVDFIEQNKATLAKALGVPSFALDVTVEDLRAQGESFRAMVADDLRASITALDDHDVAFPSDAGDDPWPYIAPFAPVAQRKTIVRQRPCKRHKVVACQAPCCR